jgi:uncharacterized protein
MIMDLSRLAPGGETFEGEAPPAILELEPDALVEAISPIRYNLFAELLPGELIVRGSLSVRIAFDCGLCAKRTEAEVRVRDFLRVREYRELAEAIDLTPDMREDIILAFPNYPVCSPECRGLCPQCGANWNETSCSCKPPGGNQTWDALDQLKKRME